MHLNYLCEVVMAIKTKINFNLAMPPLLLYACVIVTLVAGKAKQVLFVVVIIFNSKLHS